MKRVITILGMLFVLNNTLAAADSSIVSKWTDISAWQAIRIKSEQKAPLLWVSHEHKKFFIEARVNFDWTATLGFIAGKTFQKKETFWITPKAGILVGASKDAYNGTTLEANLGGTKKKFSYFAMSQLAVSFQKKNPPFVYQFVNLQYRLHKCFAVSAGYQIYQELVKGSKPSIDIGPQVAFAFKGFYLKTWYTGDPISKLQKVTFGLGYGF
jgi:hypothetical protein